MNDTDEIRPDDLPTMERGVLEIAKELEAKAAATAIRNQAAAHLYAMREGFDREHRAMIDQMLRDLGLPEAPPTFKIFTRGGTRPMFVTAGDAEEAAQDACWMLERLGINERPTAEEMRECELGPLKRATHVFGSTLLEPFYRSLSPEELQRLREQWDSMAPMPGMAIRSPEQDPAERARQAELLEKNARINAVVTGGRHAFVDSHCKWCGAAEWEIAECSDKECALLFFEDLNACAVMRGILTPEQRQEYYFHLSDIVDARANDRNTFHPPEAWKMIDATPAQHCEAFVKTLSLW